MMAIADVISIGTPILLAIIGFILKLVLDNQREAHNEITRLRSDLKDFVTKEICAAHRASIDLKIKEMQLRRAS